MYQYLPLAFTKGSDVHNRQLHILIRHIIPFYTRVVPLKIIRVIFIKQLCCKLIVFPFVGVAVIHEKLAHTVVRYSVSRSLL